MKYLFFILPGLPHHWDTMSGDTTCVSITLNAGTQEYSKIQKLFGQSCAKTIIKVDYGFISLRARRVFFFSRNLKRYHFFHPSRLSASRTKTCGRALRLRKVKWIKETVTRTMTSNSSMAQMRKLFPLSTNVVLTGVTLARMVSSSDGTQLQFFKT